MYNPNPFDFVPFAEQPLIKTEEDFASLDTRLYSGYLEVAIKALTPVHVVGYQEPQGNGRYSHIYQQNDKACIPAASIRGCLRSFIEALTSGWVSQATPEYKKEYGGPFEGPKNPNGRHIWFKTFEETNISTSDKIKPAVDPLYKPQASNDISSKLDIASFLFGVVIEKEKGENISHAALARKSRVYIEDAFIQPSYINKSKFWIPDVSDKAFMGGAKPSASNWWYMQPRKIWQRKVIINGQKRPVAEFIGERYWGRKFYYHQSPEKCVQYYDPRNHKWNYRSANAFCKVQLECLTPQLLTDTFRIYVNRIPRQLLILLVLSLLPGENIRHKLGYGKAYGFGSIEFSITGARLRIDNVPQRIPAPLQNCLTDIQKWQGLAWNRDRMQEEGFDVEFIDWQALAKLAQILGWENSDQLTFTYPPFEKGYFARGIGKRDFEEAVPDFKLEQPIEISSPKIARGIAFKLFEIKKPIHFQVYQENAKGWDVIKKRQP